MPQMLTTRQLAMELAGGDSYIRTKNGKVKGLALRLDLNPEAPEIIIVGVGPRIVRNAHLLANEKRPVPAYVKRATNQWEYMGLYHATSYRCDEETINRFRHKRSRNDVDGILFLEPVDRVSVEVIGGGFPDPQTRKEIETASIEFVVNEFELKGYKVEDRQRENCGYDLLATSSNETLCLEVKGTDAPEWQFCITRNERNMSRQREWRLALVTMARINPKLDIMTGEEMEHTFDFDSLAWECKKTNS
ncbi:protein of unknown function [Syntrophus gentianae]|uniref:Protein NO VEIN C-terminal domain-containing protein n=1 Tax=Syntrophus gentianae TaxID=43775 RepID=A0A1H7XQC8_9BACT|nr:DUF3883 domain-containing protein [Syntrophus gentianae]SEM35824.1 protein of unknown function [Syntrophus gentianae]